MDPKQHFESAVSVLFGEHSTAEELQNANNFLCSLIGTSDIIPLMTSILQENRNSRVIYIACTILEQIICRQLPKFSQDEKQFIIQILDQYLSDDMPIDTTYRKILRTLSIIVAYDFHVYFHPIFSDKPQQFQTMLLVDVIDVFSSQHNPMDVVHFIFLSINQNVIDDRLTSLLPVCLNILQHMPFSPDFLELLDSSFRCYPTFEPFGDFIPILACNIGNVDFQASILKVISDVISTNSITVDSPDLSVCVGFVQLAITLAMSMHSQGPDYLESTCFLWSNIFSFAWDFSLQEPEFCSNLISHFMQFLQTTDPSSIFVHDMIPGITSLLIEPIPELSHFFMAIYDFCISILNHVWSNPVNSAIMNISSRYPELVCEYVSQRVDNPTPGIYYAVAKAHLPTEVQYRFCEQFLRDPPQGCPFSYFLTRVGFNFPQFTQQWIAICTQCIEANYGTGLCYFTRLLEKNRTIVPPRELVDHAIDRLPRSEIDDNLTTIEFLGQVTTSYPEPNSIFTVIADAILGVCQQTIASGDLALLKVAVNYLHRVSALFTSATVFPIEFQESVFGRVYDMWGTLFVSDNRSIQKQMRKLVRNSATQLMLPEPLPWVERLLMIGAQPTDFEFLCKCPASLGSAVVQGFIQELDPDNMPQMTEQALHYVHAILNYHDIDNFWGVFPYRFVMNCLTTSFHLSIIKIALMIIRKAMTTGMPAQCAQPFFYAIIAGFFNNFQFQNYKDAIQLARALVAHFNIANAEASLASECRMNTQETLALFQIATNSEVDPDYENNVLEAFFSWRLASVEAIEV